MNVAAYYNEIDPFAAAWLRELIKAGQIADGTVDERSIVDVRPDDLRGFSQCHFFAGIGGWSLALRYSGWSDDRPVWTGSCPCQPFSAAGKGGGKDDPRHLWPQFRRLIRQCRPATVFGEQVASEDGRIWLSAVFADLEALAYRAAGADLCGPSVGAFDIRQRLWFVADTSRERRDRQRLRLQRRGPLAQGLKVGRDSETRQLADAVSTGWPEGRTSAGDGPLTGMRSAGIVADSERDGRRPRSAAPEPTGGAHPESARPGATGEGFWRDAEWIPCSDGKWRPVEPGTFPLASRIPGRVGRLRGYGNSIKPQVAAAFIEAYCEVRGKA